jgi:cell division transport system permease protein
VGVKARYLFGEAWSIARSGARQTAIAIFLTALALYVPGLLALLAKNLGRLAAAPSEAAAAVITVEPSADVRALAARFAADPRVARVRIVGSAAALERFRKAYPELGAALADLKEAPFPATLEVILRPSAPAGAGTEIARAATGWPGVEAAESEEEFGRKFRDAVRLMRGAGIFLGALLTIAAVLSIASTIRLALDLHREEIEIMRLMGATESAIRAPFWLHAAAVGLAGGIVAVLMLYGTYELATYLLSREPHPILSLFWVGFLSLPAALLLPAAGTIAGFAGSLLSLGGRSR